MKYLVTRTIALLALGLASWGLCAAEAADGRPNFLLIVADDLAFTDLGAFGGEIETPNLDALAEGGVKLTGFYTAPTCSPTRAMLLTGQDAHKVGLGAMAEMVGVMPRLGDNPGYEGYLDPAVVTVADRLAEAGYRTMMSGKWHLGLTEEHSPKAAGFQQSYVLLQGGADHFGGFQATDTGPGARGASYREGDALVRFPAGRYSSEVFTDKMLEFLKRDPADARPFFAYLAYTQPHWPLQAPQAIIDKYKGRYDAGPAAMREARFQRLEALGLLNPTQLATRAGTVGDWSALSAHDKAVASRTMEVYAAMIDSMDQNVGRVLAALQASGELDNTVIIFMSDNGAEGVPQSALENMLGMMGVGDGEQMKALLAANADPEKIGGPGSFVTYGPDWAQASTGPFRQFKASTYEGGIRTPAFVTGPGIEGARVYPEVLSVRDIMPTVLELAGISVASPAATDVPVGFSWVPMLDADPDTAMPAHEVMGFELFFRRGIRHGDWKAVFAREGEATYGMPAPGSAPPQWRLYNLRTDPGEQRDLAKSEAGKLREMIAAWERYAAANGVVGAPALPPGGAGTH